MAADRSRPVPTSSGLRRPLGALLAGALLLASLPARPEGQNKIVYDSFSWSTYSSTHFLVYHYSREKDTLPKVVSMAESAYDELSRRLNYQIPKQIPLIYYATHADFEQNNIILNFIPEGVGAFAEPARNRMVLPIDLTDEKLQALIQHELTHIFEYEILFGGRLGRALSSNAPTWFMEGLASYLGNDEDDKDRMFLRDAVNSDLIPPITKVSIEGYPAYRYGHAVFDFIEAEWGRDAVRDFIFEFRSFLGRDVSVSLKRAFEIEPDEFDLKFRRYLRKKYLPLLAVKGEASEYGERFRVGAFDRPSFEIGAAPSPSGDFIATLTTYKDDIDIALLSVKSRKVYKNLSPGHTTRYEYIVGQYLTSGPDSGRDLSFAPDGDRIAVFGRHERGRKLLIFSARGGGLIERIPVAPDVPLSPAFSPDGNTVVFAGTENNARDIFALDLKTRTVRNLTNDAVYDSAPVYSRDGKYVYHQKMTSGLSKIVRFPLEDPSKVEQVTWGEGNDEDPSLSPDGKRLYFTSSRGGIFNIYGQELETGEVYQFTDVIGAALGPAAFIGPDGQEKIAFSGFQAGRFQLYLADAKKPVKKLDEKALPPSLLTATSITAGFVPAVEVTIDPEKTTRPKGFKLFLENANVLAGINSDQTFVSQIQLLFSDVLGNKRGLFQFDSVSTFSNFRFAYFNLSKRLQWGIQLYDTRTYFNAIDTSTGDIVRDRRFFKETGLTIDGVYPISRYTRFEANVGFISRTLDVPYYVSNAAGNQFQFVPERTDNAPTAGVGFSYDTSRYRSFGPHSGNRLDLHFQYTPDLKDGGSLTRDVFVDARQYIPISRRSLLAFRVFGGISDGNAPTVFYFGGYDTLRGVDFRTQIGNRVFYMNAEFRFPLIDVVATPFVVLQGVRGHIFLDVGGAWLKDQPFQFWDGGERRLKDGISAYGAGFSVYFLGLPWNVDFARQWDFRSSLSDFTTQFYVGYTF
ncbi:MAG: BamA/TamA family outer membrane protein [Thermoanaerobaculia bacterium]